MDGVEVVGRTCDLKRVNEADGVPGEAATPDDRTGAGYGVGPGSAAGGVVAVDEQAGLLVQAVAVNEFKLVQHAGGVDLGVVVGLAIQGCEGGEAVHAVAVGEIAVGFVWWRGICEIPEPAFVVVSRWICA